MISLYLRNIYQTYVKFHRSIDKPFILVNDITKTFWVGSLKEFILRYDNHDLEVIDSLSVLSLSYDSSSKFIVLFIDEEIKVRSYQIKGRKIRLSRENYFSIIN